MRREPHVELAKNGKKQTRRFDTDPGRRLGQPCRSDAQQAAQHIHRQSEGEIDYPGGVVGGVELIGEPCRPASGFLSDRAFDVGGHGRHGRLDRRMLRAVGRPNEASEDRAESALGRRDPRR